MYNELKNEGYTDNNIYLLFGRGYDYEPTTFPIAPKYDPEPNIIDYPARVEAVESIFEWLRDSNTTENIPALTEDDFLFVWTYDHGGPGDTCPLPHEDSVYLCLMNNKKIWDWEFAELVNQISCNKKATDSQISIKQLNIN